MTTEIGFSDKFTAAALLAQTTKDMAIINAEDYKKCLEGVAEIRKQEAALDAAWDEFKEKCGYKAAQKQHAELKMILENARKTGKQNANGWADREEAKRLAEENRLAAEAKAQAEAEALDAAVAAEAQGAHQEAEEILEAPVIVPVVVLPKQTPKVAGHTRRMVKKWRLFAASGTYTKDEWKASTRVPALEVPKLGAGYLAVNPAALTARAESMGKAGSIPGLFEVYEESV